MRREPPKNRKASSYKSKGQVKHNLTLRKEGKGPVVHHENHVERIAIPVSPGEESVSVGYDIKYWASEDNHGMTIGCSAHVKISCGPDEMDKANEVASDLAWDYLEKNVDRATSKLNDFVDGK